MLIWILHIALTSVLFAVGVDEFVDDLCEQLMQGRPRSEFPENIKRHLGSGAQFRDPFFAKLKIKSERDFALHSVYLAGNPEKKQKEILAPLKEEIVHICYELEDMCGLQDLAGPKEALPHTA